MTWLRLAGIVGPFILLIVTGLSVADRIHLKKMVTRYQQCSAAAKSDTASVAGCDADIAARVTAARQAAECEAALKLGDLYAIRATCGAQGKRVQAELTAAQVELGDARQQLRVALADRDQAVSRAEARATTHASRTAQNDRTIDAAPRGANGLLRCDADCLRSLAGEPGAQP